MLPTKVPAIVPPEITSFQVVAPEVAKLDALLASNSKAGEELTEAFAEVEYPERPQVSTKTLRTRRTIRNFTTES